MRTSTFLLAASTAGSVLGVPLVKKDNYDPLPGGDIDILNYALTLEFLERKFYEQGLANYTKEELTGAGLDANLYENLQTIYSDEKTHVDFLAGALGDKAIPEPTFAFPSTDAKSFLGLSAILEGVGVSAYLGAAAVIADKAYVTAAGAILTVEARHAAYIRNAIGQKPFPTPFDTPLNFNQVFSLAAQFVASFAPGTPELPFRAFPSLSVVKAGHGLVFPGAAAAAEKEGLLKYGQKVSAVFYSGLDTYYGCLSRNGNDYVLHYIPQGKDGKAGPAGQVYVILSTADGNTVQAADENTVAGVGILEL
ncbi:hypothetical protein BN1723_002270 [Verticillium longisporum]|uniref:Ferritin-like domain-containing protein n=1 Tax=Verticillium longisporum TaxID=100787 RepID=A0A0G4L261_VERLO|nr:Protein rds1 like protein [Verticillium longisporum]CRK16097.1 hypothetical protein BN1723_002270 [Verticillium longisporum]CRK42076.1 hypothetical protein BN1708_008640 [Verticillium longisporum]